MAGKIVGVPQALFDALDAAWDARAGVRGDLDGAEFWVAVRDTESAIADAYQMILNHSDALTPLRKMTIDAQTARRRAAEFAQAELDRLSGSGCRCE